MEKFYRQLDLAIKSVNEEKATADFVISTNDLDRHGDIVEQNWELGNFKQNPVVLNSHTYGDVTEVIGRMLRIGVMAQSVDRKQLEGTVQFAVEQNPKAKIIWQLVRDGFVNAVSAGFIPKEFDDKGNILKSELLEVSIVAVPANQMALAKAKGIEVDKLTEKYEKTKDSEQPVEDNDEHKDGDGDESASESNGGENNGGESDDETVGSDENNNDGSGEGESGNDKKYGEGEADGKTREQIIVENALKVLETIDKFNTLLSEFPKVVTREHPVRAKSLRVLNKSVRSLIKLKNKI